MNDINNAGKKNTKLRFTPPGGGTQSNDSPKTLKIQPSAKPKRPEPLVQDGFRDLYHPPKKSTRSKKVKNKRFSFKKIAASFLLIIILSGIGVGAWHFKKNNQPKMQPAIQSTLQNEQPEPQKITGNFRILATGDIITHDSVYQNAKKSDGSYDFSPMLSELKPILEKSPARICHNTVPAAGGNISGYPSFNAPSELISSLSGSGCNVLSLASDHINDKGQAAINATLSTIEKDKNIVISAGANKSAEQQAAARYFNIGDGLIKFAYFSFTTRQNKPNSSPYGVNIYDKAKAKSQIQEVRSTADLVIVSVCWGKEDSGDIQPTQETMAQELSAAGVDLILGHCPHVLQPLKKIKSSDGDRETIVYYSLGNALNTQLSIENLIGGLAVVDFDLETKKITNFGFMPTYMHYDWSAADKSARNLNARKNLKLYPLDKASEAFKKSQNNTTVKAQNDKVRKIINRFTATQIFSSDELKAE